MIQTISEALGGLDEGAVYAILIYGVLQLSIQAWALVDLSRRERVRYGKKWFWAVVILALSSFALGTIGYVAFGRSVPQRDGQQPHPNGRSGESARAVVESLYEGEVIGR